MYTLWYYLFYPPGTGIGLIVVFKYFAVSYSCILYLLIVSSHVAGYPIVWHCLVLKCVGSNSAEIIPHWLFFNEDLTWAFSPRHLISEGSWGIGFFKASWQIWLQLVNEFKIKWGLRNGKQRKNCYYLSLAFCNKTSLWRWNNTIHTCFKSIFALFKECFQNSWSALSVNTWENYRSIQTEEFKLAFLVWGKNRMKFRRNKYLSTLF